ncbi:MAG: hypothetical protein GWM92_17375, partial [Gemmatimonadetes bacterium]|nr:hypothetical protein [Gemmatimonadota bacterium]NIT89303.1 hypothetical protein [Gemmatimonadota bacterium]NIU33111.1 hypothetical protein [Gemmatimonadota bacterium]NIU37480.1 hypothetical protein [Gemmatimonadota bacterium]NIV63464.1 hypothetical protein [Gemmatimonadota bacterium]
MALDEGGGITAWEARTGRSLGSVRGDGFGGRLLDFEWVPGTELLAVAESDSTTGDAGVNVVDASSPDPVDWSLVTRKLFVGLPGSKLEFIHDLDFNVDGTRLAAVQRFKGDVVVVETGSRDPGDWRVSTTLEFSKPFEA